MLNSLFSNTVSGLKRITIRIVLQDFLCSVSLNNSYVFRLIMAAISYILDTILNYFSTSFSYLNVKGKYWVFYQINKCFEMTNEHTVAHILKM